MAKRVAEFLGKLGIKAPWKYTGPVSSPEYRSHLPKAIEFRHFGPASPPIRAVVPQAEADKVFNIKYYTRDTRRDSLPGGPKVLERYAFDVTAKDEAAAATADVPLTPGITHKWSKPRSILEQDNNGYTL